MTIIPTTTPMIIPIGELVDYLVYEDIVLLLPVEFVLF